MGFVSYLSAAEWKKHTVVPAGKGSINGVSASDFDKDGQVDVITSVGGEVILLKGPDWKKFPVHQFVKGLARNKPHLACIHSCLMDVDGDGDMDFIGSNQTVFWLECPDNPFSGTPWKYRTVDDEILGTHCVVSGDVNRDGKLDLIANSFRDPNSTKFYNSIVWLEVPEIRMRPRVGFGISLLTKMRLGVRITWDLVMSMEMGDLISLPERKGPRGLCEDNGLPGGNREKTRPSRGRSTS